MSGYGRHLQLVDLGELLGLGLGGAGHAGQLLVHPEVVLDGNGGHRLGLFLDHHLFLGLQRLVQAVTVAPPSQDPAGKIVHYQHLAVLDHVPHVLFVQGVGPQQLADMVDGVAAVAVEALHLFLAAQHLLSAQAVGRVDSVEGFPQVGDYERVRIVGGNRVAAHIGEIDDVAFLIDEKI